MARTGRPRKPAQIHRLHGTWRADRHNDAEPQPERLAPRCPKHVQGEARKEWRRKTKELLPMGVMSLADRASLERYCLWYAIGHETVEKLNAPEIAKLYKTPSGYPMLNPLIALWRQACEMMDKFDTEFD